MAGRRGGNGVQHRAQKATILRGYAWIQVGHSMGERRLRLGGGREDFQRRGEPCVRPVEAARQVGERCPEATVTPMYRI